MTRKSTFRLGDLQLRIMKVLWSAGPATVADVQERLEGGPLAYTTVATMLRKMEERDLVSHRQEGRTFLYEPRVTEEAVVRGMADDLLDRLFAGSLADAVSHLLESREVSRRELTRLEELIAKHKRRL